MSNSSSAEADPPSPSPEGATGEGAAEPAEPAAAGGAEPASAAASGAETAPAGTAGGTAPDAPAKPKKKKKRKREAPTGPTRDPLAPDGSERPAFLLEYPSDPELDRLVQAFELGNYAYVREHAPVLAEKSTEPRVRAAAGELARRIEPDPLVKLLLAMSFALFLALALWAYATHGS